jgi:hypothetical protein
MEELEKRSCIGDNKSGSRKKQKGGFPSMKYVQKLSLLVFVILCLAGSQAAAALNPKIISLIQCVSSENVEAYLKKLASFQTRHVLSSDKEGFGNRAAAEWLQTEFERLNPRLKVSLETYELPPQGGRISRDTTIRNVVAILPGRQTGPDERIFVLNAHYDTVARKADGTWSRDDFDNNATGVNDDASGVAALLELARVFKDVEFDATIYFVAFSGEEIGLVGSTLMAARLKEENKNVCGVIGLDMIGNIEGGSGRIDNSRMRVFSDGPMDSLSRQLARYAKHVGERYFPSVEVDLIYRADRFGRGGDHTPFVQEGWAGIRMMEANENYSRQHTIDDTFDHMSLGYCTRNIRIVGSVLASLAAAPPAPRLNDERGRPMLGRGESGYDAALKWEPVLCDDLAGYIVHWRKTTSPYWEKTIPLGNVNEHLFDDMTIDEYVFGVAAVDKEGNESMISAYSMAPRSKREYKVKK